MLENPRFKAYQQNKANITPELKHSEMKDRKNQKFDNSKLRSFESKPMKSMPNVNNPSGINNNPFKR